jgi:hypothetical protein
MLIICRLFIVEYELIREVLEALFKNVRLKLAYKDQFLKWSLNALITNTKSV